MFFKKKFGMIIILFIFLLLNVILINFYNNIFWDSAVYIGMGKFLYSFGNSGFLEPSRPIILPLILGFIWKINLDVVIFGKILELLFGGGCIYLTYLICKQIFNKKIALISALFLAFSPTFFIFSTKILTEIPSLFFILLSVYFFTNKKYFLTGLFAGIAFLTRFLELFLFFVIFIIFLLCFNKEKKFLKNLSYLLIGFLIIIVPYLIFNYFMYNNILYPFDLQLLLTKYTGFIFHQPFYFYFINLLKENIMILFAIPALIFIFKKINYEKFLILFSFLVFFIFFNIVSHKEIRFMILFLPYLYIITSFSIFSVFNKIKNKKIFFTLFLIIFLIWFSQTTIQIKNNYDEEFKKIDKYLIFQNYLDKDIRGNIWITNPIFAINSNKKINELIYYHTFNHNKFLFLKANIKNANHILINTCDLYCEPYNEFCEDDKKELINLLKNNFNIIFFQKENNCESYIFA